MENKKVKNFSFRGGMLTDIHDGIVDIFVTLEDDDFEYWVEVATPQGLSSMMEKYQENFIEPAFPRITVRELTTSVIREALDFFTVDKEDAFWLKIYHLPIEFNMKDLNTILERQKKTNE